MEIDSRDRALLEVLGRNCRVPHTVLADLVRLSPNTVSYRIESLERSGIISDYALVLDLRTLGFTRHHLLLRLSCSSDKIHDLCKKLSKSPSVVWVASYVGTYDVQIIADSHAAYSLNSVIDELFSILDHQVSDYAVFTDDCDVEFKQLPPELQQNVKFDKNDDGSFSHILSDLSYPAPRKFKEFYLRRGDIELLKALANDPRSSLTDLSDSVDLDRQTVRRRIERLIKERVILNLGAVIDTSKLDYITYHFLFRLNQGTPYDKVREVFSGEPSIYYAGTNIGSYDLSAYIYARNPEELGAIIQKIRTQLGGAILRYDLLIVEKWHYWKQLSRRMVSILSSEN